MTWINLGRAALALALATIWCLSIVCGENKLSPLAPVQSGVATSTTLAAVFIWLAVIAFATAELGAHETATGLSAGIGSAIGVLLGSGYSLVGLMAAAGFTSPQAVIEFDASRFPGALVLWEGTMLAPAAVGAIPVFVALSASVDLARWPRSVCRAVALAGPAAIGTATVVLRLALAAGP